MTIFNNSKLKFILSPYYDYQRVYITSGSTFGKNYHRYDKPSIVNKYKNLKEL